MGLTVEKIGNAVIVAQTTYYYYTSEEDRKNDKFSMCTSDRKAINVLKRQIRKDLKTKKL